jgi:hypothetical protein
VELVTAAPCGPRTVTRNIATKAARSVTATTDPRLWAAINERVDHWSATPCGAVGWGGVLMPVNANPSPKRLPSRLGRALYCCASLDPGVAAVCSISWTRSARGVTSNLPTREAPDMRSVVTDGGPAVL